MTDSTEQMRAAFKAHIMETTKPISANIMPDMNTLLARNLDGTYYNSRVQEKYEVWQAALASTAKYGEK